MRLSSVPLFCGVCVLASMLPSCHFAYEDSKTVPAQPNYAEHVRPIFEHHCTLCHGVPSDRGAPSYFTLQQYDVTTGGLLGAKLMSGDVVSQIEQNLMPPAAEWGDGLGPNDKKIIALWVQNGAPRDAGAAANPNSNQN